LIERITASSLRHPGKFLGASLALALAGGLLASRLEVRSSFAELLPRDVPSVQLLHELIRRVGGDGTVLVMVEALEGERDLPRAEAMAHTLAREYLALGPDVIRAVEWNVKPIAAWYGDHWPMFAPLGDLEKAERLLADAKRKAKSRMLDLGLDDEDGGADAAALHEGELGKLLDPARPSPRQEVAKRFERYRDGFLVHPDGRSVTIVVRPTGTSLGVDETRQLLARMQALADRHRPELTAQRLHVGYGGTFPAFLVEYESIIRDVGSTFLMVVSIVLASLWLFYRDMRSVTALAVPILAAVAVTFGITWLSIGYLNTQTAFLGSIVVGNGINYGLIYLARLNQLRREGKALDPACIEAAGDAWRATLLAALGTSVSFGTLVFAANRGFRHFGIIGGIGMVLSWAMTFALVPALMKIMERLKPWRDRRRKPAGGAPARAAAWELPFRRPGWIVTAFALATLAATAFFVARLPYVEETNLENLANDVRGDPVWRRDSERANAATGRSNAGAIALLPSEEATEAYCAVVDARVEERKQDYLLDGCETLATVVPSQQPQKLAVLGRIRAALSDAVLESLPPAEAARARSIRDDLGRQGPMTVAEAPPSLLDRFRERDGTIGRIAFVRASGHAKLELAPNMFAFASLVRGVPVGGRTWDAVGENLIFADLLANVQREGPMTTLVSFVGVCLLVLLFFRRWGPASQVLLSLVVGTMLMAGAATLIGLKVNVFNFIVFPITFGIAVDYAANVADRAALRGDVLGSLREVGPAVMLCSWTSLVGYSSMLFSHNKALRSFGWYANVGELTTLAAAMVFIPALALLRGRPRRAERERLTA